MVTAVAIFPARRTAFDLLLRVERGAAYSDELLHSPLLDRLGIRARALVTELVMGCLRRRGELDFLLTKRLRKAVESLDLEVRTALRMGAYQLRCMDRVPPGAAVSDSVELVKMARKRSAAGLVNAVLRNLPASPADEEGARRSHPDWLRTRWEKKFGRSACQKLLAANICRPPAYVRAAKDFDLVDMTRELTENGLALEPTGFQNAFKVAGDSVSNTRAVHDGRLIVQDLSSQLVVPLLSVKPGHRVLDICAAPGGKARQLAEEVGGIVASDRSGRRLQTLRRLGSSGLRILALNAKHSLPFRIDFDRIRVDAPCSGTGTLARNPEIKWRLKPADLSDLQAWQLRILRRALDVLSPSGRLIYSTCSLEPEDNEHVIDQVLAERTAWTSRKVFDRLPGRDAGDGFQAWLICRDAA